MTFTPARFWARVLKEDNDGCWIWQGATNGSYGTLDRFGRKARAHRVSYELTYGPIPEGLGVLHSCDTPKCVRPDHLFLGTQRVNAEDMVLKDRATYAKLSVKDVKEIKAALGAGARGVDLARKYGVSKPTISAIKKGLRVAARD